MWPKIVCKMFFMMQSNGKANIMLKIELKVYVLVYVIRESEVDRRPKPTAEGRIFYSYGYGYGGRRFRAIASAECTLEISMSDESTIEGCCLPQANFSFFSRVLFMSSRRYAKM